jgi:GDP-4-dehydro-6-deoxy-D-mannose reductase
MSGRKSISGGGVHGRVLVTGAQGLLGRRVVAALLADGADAVLGVGRSPRRDDVYTHDLAWLGERLPAPVPDGARIDASERRYAYRALDAADATAVAATARDFEPDAVIHTAAALRDSSFAALVQSNVVATAGLIEGLAAAGRPRLVLTSSGSVYGAGGEQVPFREDGPAEPLDLYGASKRASEDIARILAAQHGLRLVQARVFNLVGPGLQDRHLPAVLAARVAAIARGLAEPVLELGPLTSTRDFIDVEDAARALVGLSRDVEVPPVVNVASGCETEVRSVLDLLLRVAGRDDVEVRTGAGRRTDVARAYADVSRLQALGWHRSRELADTLSAMLGYFMTFPPAPPRS